MSIYSQCTVVKNVFIFSGVATPVSLKGACNTASSGSACPSPVSSDGGGTFPQELIDNFALNLHRIDKDVERCDRNHPYFKLPNLEKLRNIITTYVWDNLDVGYMQGMCDIVAPLLVVFNEEAITHSCFAYFYGKNAVVSVKNPKPSAFFHSHYIYSDIQ